MLPDSLLDRFQSPTPADRGRVLWIWNGSLDRGHLLRQLRQFHALGLAGALIRAGSGLRTAYLGTQWFEMVNACADEAARLGLKLWLADEERGPSGAAGGLATAGPAHARKFLRLKVATGAFEWPKQSAFVKAWAARVDGFDFRECEPLEYKATPPTDGRAVLIFTTGTCRSEMIYNDHPPLDLLSREATAHFLSVTHDRYRKHALTRLGAVIDGFFTDTPSPGTIMAANASLPDAEWTVPWTPGLWDEFQRAWGYDLREHLPELFLFPEGRRFSRVKLNFASTIQRLLETNWLRPLREWCETARMSLVGRLPGGASAAEQSASCPSTMRVVEFVDVPVIAGADFPTLKHVASVARQLGGRRVLDFTPLSGAPADLELPALHGVTSTFPGAEPLSREGIAKRVYGRRIEKAAADASARLHLLLGAGERACDVVIINPIETTWAQIHPGWAVSEEVRALDQKTREITTWLGEAQIDYDFADEGVLARRASVLHGRLGLGPASYRVVIVAGLATLRSTTLELLRQMTVTGGTVVFIGPPPMHVDGRDSSAALALAVDATRIEPSRSALLRAVAPEALPVVLDCASGQQDLLCQVRHAGERWIVALKNTSATARHGDVSVLLESAGVIEEWHCDSGTTTPVEVESGDTSQRWQTSFEPRQLRIFVASPAASPARVTAPAPAPAAEELTLHELTSAECQEQRDLWSPACDIIALDRALRESSKFPQRDEPQIQPWSRQESFGSTMRVKRLKLRFRFRLEAIPSGPFDLVIESPASKKLTLNDTDVRVPSVTEWHGDPSQRRLPLPVEALRDGENEIVALIPFIDETDLEPIGLLGRFTVVESDGIPTLRPR